jgi:hypothetical protein
MAMRSLFSILASARQEDLDPALRAAVVAFLRRELPQEARRAYREMILRDPAAWMHHPHFQGSVIVRHFLRGNGLTERALGVMDLEPLWPDLLRDAVLDEPSTVRNTGRSRGVDARAS